MIVVHIVDSENGISETGKSIKMKKHNTADTSREVYRDLVRTGKIKTEQELVYDFIKANQPLTNRQIVVKMGIEIGNITRCMSNLKKLGRIKVAYTAKCQDTDRRVSYHTTLDWVPDNMLPKAA